MILIALAFYRNFRNKKKANILLSQQNQAIEQQKQRLQQLDESRSQFFANISHELRTPLTLISGPLESLSKQKAYNEDATQIALRNTRKLKGLVDDILDLSKLESFRIKVEETPVNVRALMSRVASNYESMAGRLEIEFQTAIDDTIADWLRLDAPKLEKIVNNLLMNAIKYTGAGGRVALIITRADEYLRIQVNDSGQGIPAEDLPYIFERYFQSRQPKAPIQGGTGIGLSLAHELAIIMDGELTVESEVGKGSKFTCLLPYRVAIDPGVRAEDFAIIERGEVYHDDVANEAIASTVEVPESARILYVEDNLDMQEYTSNLLRESYKVTTVSNGRKALEHLAANDFDLVITDAMMPEMDGYTLIEHMKSDEQYQMIPIIMLTALNFEDNKLQALAIGVDDYLTKPFSATELMARAKNLIARSATRKSWLSDMRNEQTDTPNPSTSDSQEEEVLSIQKSDVTWLKEVQAHIWDQVEDETFNITNLADQFHLSRRQFQRRIKKMTGLSPKQYQHEISLQKARQLLEQSAYANVSAVAYASGIRNPSRFAQMYYQRFGKKPGDYFTVEAKV